METENLARQFVEHSISYLKTNNLMRKPRASVPQEMIDESEPDRDDWVTWKAVPSLAMAQKFFLLEEKIGLKFPPLYRELLSHKHFLELAGPIRFYPHPVRDWKEMLLRNYFDGWDPERIIRQGLIPFGDESFMDAGPVCFDARTEPANEDYPVVFWDNEWVGTEKEINPLFSSASIMFRSLIFAVRQGPSFFSHHEGDSSSELPKKRALLKSFLGIDPSGAGGPARDYWTSWGVKP